MQEISIEEVKRLRQLVTELSRKNTLLEKNDKLQKEIIKELKVADKLKNEIIKNQEEKIKNLELQIEELRKIVFKPKKKISNKQSEKKIKEKRTKESYQRNIPKDSEVTKEINHEISKCPDCNLKLTKKKIITFYIEDIKLPTNKENNLKVVEKHNAEKGYCSKCKKYHSAINIPSAKVTIGPNVKMYVTYLTILLRSSYSQIVKLFKDTYNFKLSEGEINNILNNEAISLKPEFERLKESIRNQKGIHMDETSWKVHDGELGNYAWIMTGTDTGDVVFDIGKSRGRSVAKKLQGDKKLIGISDDYNAYKKLFKLHQLCWAHPHRKLRDLANSDKLKDKTKEHCKETYLNFKNLYNNLQEILRTEFNLKERESKKKELMKEFIKISKDNTKDPEKLKNIKKSLLKNKEKYFVCLINKDIPADNNKAERNLRHLVLKRKISFGSMTQKGADRLSILASVLLSLWNRNPDKLFEEYLSLKD
jgi:transposase